MKAARIMLGALAIGGTMTLATPAGADPAAVPACDTVAGRNVWGDALEEPVVLTVGPPTGGGHYGTATFVQHADHSIEVTGTTAEDGYSSRIVPHDAIHSGVRWTTGPGEPVGRLAVFRVDGDAVHPFYMWSIFYTCG